MDYMIFMPILVFIVIAFIITGASVLNAKRKNHQEEERKKYDRQVNFRAQNHSGIAPKSKKIVVPPTASTREPMRVSVVADRLASGHGHASAGDAIEFRPDTSGSLGDQETEGCVEHNNIRFLTKTTETEEGQQTIYDYDQIALAIVLGSALSQPKYKDL
ncbi:MAG: hypothetical protein RR248_05485 [Clostridia bacterium]